MRKILTIATAGLRPGQLEDHNNIVHGRVDYLELRRRIGVDILNYDIYRQTYNMCCTMREFSHQTGKSEHACNS